MRVFNISLHKTATSSMWVALDTLGFKSYHYDRNLCALFAEGQQHTWPDFQQDNIALHDVPTMLMYRMLYHCYHDAKFILVVRPFDKWYESVKAHLNRPNLWVLPNTLMYGYPISANDCPEDLCRKVYDRHHADVAEFFADKGNLLTIQLEELDWGPICDFLDKPIPMRPFPHVYKTPDGLRSK